jgi:predicted ester cyclase
MRSATFISNKGQAHPNHKEYQMDTNTQPTSPTQVFREWQRCLAANDQEGAAKVVDTEGYTEICLGLTQWTIGYELAAANYYRNMVAPWRDITFTIEDLTESAGGVTVRSHVTGTHTGEFLGIAPTGRHVEWDHVAIVKVKDGRVVGQWAQPDLWGIYMQLTRSDSTQR